MKKLLVQVFTWWNGQTLGTRFHTWRKGTYVATDEVGNRYYLHKKTDRRWVIYAGVADGSFVPAGWQAWLHHTADVPPSEQNYRPREWEKAHQPNLTGTPGAYRPPGSMLGADSRPRVTGDYEPWRP